MDGESVNESVSDRERVRVSERKETWWVSEQMKCGWTSQ